MKKSEFRQLIREEIRKVLKETKYRVGQAVDDINGDIPFTIKTVYPNKQTALTDLKKKLNRSDYEEMLGEVEDWYTSYKPIGKSDDLKPWYVLTMEDGDDNSVPYLVPEVHVFSRDED